VSALKADGGNEEIDEALRHPPASTAELMDIFRYLDRANVSSSGATTTTMALPALPSGAKKTDSGDFGALYWYLTLARRLDVHKAMEAVEGWAADSSITYREASGRVCVEADYRGEGDVAAQTMAQLLEQWKAVGPATDATIDTSGDVVHFRSCDPGTSVRLPGKDRSSDAIEFDAARIEVAEEFFKDHVPNSVSSCAIGKMFGDLSLDDVIGVDSGSASAATEQKVQQALADAVASCH